MTDFTITYDYTEEMLEETLVATIPFGFFTFHILIKWILPILTIMTTILAIVMRTPELMESALFSFLCLFGAHLFKNYILRVQKDRTRMMHGGKFPRITCTVKTQTQELEFTPENGASSTINLNALKQIAVTTNLISLLFEGQICVPIPKNKFQQGNAEDLLFWLKQTFPTMTIKENA